MPKRSALTLAILALAAHALAGDTKFWRQDDPSDFEKGSLNGLSLSSDGRLALAPQVQEVFDASTPYLWTIARDSKGNLYTGGGGTDAGNARVYKISAEGKSSTLADLAGIAVQAIAVDRSDRVYVATSPDGKVYSIDPSGKPQDFFDPKSRYIWALAFDGPDLLVASGDPGKVFRVKPDGSSSLFFDTGETHARSLAVASNGDVLVGTDPGGLIIRVSPAGEGFVLYQTPKSEVAALAISPNGDIYAAALGSKAVSTVPPASTPVTPVAITPSQTPLPSPTPSRTSPAFPAASHLGAAAGGSEVYRIGGDGSPEKIWSDQQALVYSIAFDASGRPLLGTGNRGAIYRIDSPVLSTRLSDVAPTQITAFCAAPDGALYAATGNVGKVYRIGPAPAAEGTLESSTLDAGWFSRWGRLTLQPSGVQARIWTRSGNLDRPQQNWSAWAAVPLTDGSGLVKSPPARFLQYKLALRGSAALSSLSVAYLPKNVAPQVEEIEITPANYRFPAPSILIAANPQNISLPPLGSSNRSPGLSLADIGGSASSMSYAKGYIGARWNANDENGDTLVYTIEIRRAGETAWRPLKDKLREPHFSWDSAAFPDGEYQVRVTASDEGSNPAPEALTATLVSDPFLIDNTPPRIAGAAAVGSTVAFQAHDALSIIAKAEYSVDGGDWRIVDPVGKLSDSRDEDYSLTLGHLSSGEHVVALRVTDDYDNQAVAQVIVH